MFNTKSVDFIWLVLMGLTLLSAAIAESPDQGLVLILVITFTVAYKGRMIVDHFMELKDANRLLRNSMRVYFYVIPGMIVLVYLFPDLIARLTTL
ncbi:MAG: thiosulfate reductase [gamma proteobacterium symbiont of Ctena orbiculata]|uniref:Cytochrome C oxidase subunit IV family protein n=1 Tax=Candidatus Thiodiazotropha taylori TaxID=2792791 RepID=A0A944MAN4_9GAMM|nr:cytochrome C oxidase subunit IV family protein [Candidatus Thiodiazotropha taylori]PUB90014.1 MAG: thiosulfate reductase [gamma proteobacterium symbiont of Ctena orbiculata]MBT2991046.1 cytochrome C oxidase subunit IV family protein [Candidatus Thiodiazotropha taylori]MBT2996616.1 cytochrome C oxidase subunit IV family protein [Candidatus Thiodiazotropha taylori]MBT3000656.1 cytochrome C oxidase subunit IV family protein [Candidatus Thiodiazotropha taylori]